jgi:hypothetical protein
VSSRGQFLAIPANCSVAIRSAACELALHTGLVFLDAMYRGTQRTCAEANLKPVLCAALIGENVVIGMGTGHLLVYTIDFLLDALDSKGIMCSVSSTAPHSQCPSLLECADNVTGVPY